MPAMGIESSLKENRDSVTTSKRTEIGAGKNQQNNLIAMPFG